MQNDAGIDAAPLRSAGQDLVSQAEAIKIASQADAERAGAMLLDVKALAKKIEEKVSGPKKATHDAWKAIVALEKEMLELPAKAERILKVAISHWTMAENKRCREEEARLAEEARKRQEEERLAEAVELEAAGQPELAEAVIEAPVVAPVVKIAPPKIAGISTAKRFTFRIVDPEKIARVYLIPDEVTIGKIVRAMGKDAEKTIGGIVVEEVEDVRVGGR